VAFLCQILIVAIYWGYLHPLVREGLDPSERFLHFHLRVVHSLPFLSLLVNLILSRMVFIRKHAVYICFLGLGYSVANYLGTLYRKKPLYPFLKWEGFESIVFCVIFVLGACILFQGPCLLLERASG